MVLHEVRAVVLNGGRDMVLYEVKTVVLHDGRDMVVCKEVRTAVLHDGRDMILHEVGAWFCMMEGVSVLHDSALHWGNGYA